MDSPPLTGIYRYHAVHDGLSTSGQPTEAELARVARAGFAVVINLALHDDPRYSLRDERGTVAALSMEYVHIPVRFGAPTESDLESFFAAMKRHRHQKILVHCAANVRVSAFLGLYFAIVQRQPVGEAFALMKAIWEPNAVWSAFIAAMLARGRG